MSVKLEYDHLSNFYHCVEEKMRTPALFIFEFSYLTTIAPPNAVKDF